VALARSQTAGHGVCACHARADEEAAEGTVIRLTEQQRPAIVIVAAGSAKLSLLGRRQSSTGMGKPLSAQHVFSRRDPFWTRLSWQLELAAGRNISGRPF
jgi:hypothetical protein